MTWPGAAEDVTCDVGGRTWTLSCPRSGHCGDGAAGESMRTQLVACERVTSSLGLGAAAAGGLRAPRPPSLAGPRPAAVPSGGPAEVSVQNSEGGGKRWTPGLGV